LIPLIIIQILHGKPLPGVGGTVRQIRDWTATGRIILPGQSCLALTAAKSGGGVQIGALVVVVTAGTAANNRPIIGPSWGCNPCAGGRRVFGREE